MFFLEYHHHELTSRADLIRYCAFNEFTLALIHKRRGATATVGTD